jgi:fluoroacetyl-CoA thioesterase
METKIMLKTQIPVDLKLTMNFLVMPEHTTSHLDARLPEVLATCVMVQWMETVAVLAVQPYLTEGYITVGLKIDLEHFTFTPMGHNIHIYANISNIQGNFINYDLVAVSNTEIVGKAHHRRAVVSQKLIQRQISKKTK